LILFGTDTPSGPIYGNPPGYNGYMEIKLMHEAGVPLNKILESATVNNAKMFKLDSLAGSIEAGKRANMLILTRNPLAEVEAYDNIETVILLGKLLPRDTLSVPR
jgi:imidazolonepropionase-like amidohydrolase